MKTWNNKLAAIGASALALGFRAAATAPDYSPISVDGDGNITATPSNLITPVLTGLVVILSAIAAVKLLKVLAGYVFRWFRG